MNERGAQRSSLQCQRRTAQDHSYRYVLEHPTVDVTIMGPRNTSASPASPLISPGYEADRRPEGGAGESRRRSAAGW